MRIVHEMFDKEHYLELCISPREFDLIKDYFIVSKKVCFRGEETNVGVKLGLDIEDDENGDGI